MIVLGLGNDIIDIRRIERSLDRFGDRFVNRVFTEIEQRKSDKRANRAASYRDCPVEDGTARYDDVWGA